MSGHHPAITHHGDPVGDPLDFIHAVADVDDANPLALEPPNVCKQLLDFGISQCGCRFIENDQAGIPGQYPGDFDQLLLAHPQG